MSTVTSIKPQKSGKRVNIYLDGKFGFGLDLENYLTLGLKVEQELTEEEVNKIVKKAEFQKTLDKLLRFVTLRPRSVKEIYGWFRKKKVPESLYAELVEKLKHFDLLDDEKFAKWWVEQRQSFRPKSKNILQNELLVKGIKRETIREVLENTEIDEGKIAKELLLKKSYKWKNLGKREARQKMSNFLAGKGFSWDIISKVTNNNED